MKSRYAPVKELIDPIVKSYRKDMEYDEQEVDNPENLESEFIVSARETGTHIIVMRPSSSKEWPEKGERVKYLFATATREEILQDVLNMAQWIQDHYSGPVYYIMRDGFKEIQPQQIVGIVSEYVSIVQSNWNARK